MKLRKLLGLFLVSALVMSSVTIWLTIELNGALDRVIDAEQRRFDSLSIADELRQSSNDLTKLARLFVRTGEERFVGYFRQVLAIRNGELPRPDGYKGVSWDRVTVEYHSPLDRLSGRGSSLQDRMGQLGFAESEFELLAEAQKRSDELTSIENRAFNAVRGLYDDGTGKYTRVGAPDAALAERLLYGESYLLARAFIMEPIRRFEEQVNSRTLVALTAVRDEAEVIVGGTFVAAGGLFSLLVGLSVIVHRRVLLRAGILASTARQIAAGELDGRSGVRGDDELGILGRTFDEMVARLAESLTLVTAAKDRMEKELSVGREIQMSMVPLTFPPFPEHEEFSICAILEPAREVGGDFYDFFFVDKERFCFCIGDVSGKGVSSALFMAVAKTLIKSRAVDDHSTASILTHVNDELSANNKESMFVTLFIGILNIKTGQVVFTNAGHNPPYLCRRGTPVRRLNESHGPVIGAMEGMVYAEDVLELAPADSLCLYTDGVTEAMNTERAFFSEHRLAGLLEKLDGASSEAIVEDTFAAVKQFEGDADQTDDIAILAMQYLGYARPSRLTTHQVVINNDLSEIAKLSEEFEAFTSEVGIAESIAVKLNLVLDELLSNVISYAFRDDAGHEVTARIEASESRLTLTVTDDGVPFNPLAAKPPDTLAGLDERQIGGLGIHLVRSLVDHVAYQRRIGKNILTVAIVLEPED